MPFQPLAGISQEMSAETVVVAAVCRQSVTCRGCLLLHENRLGCCTSCSRRCRQLVVFIASDSSMPLNR